MKGGGEGGYHFHGELYFVRIYLVIVFVFVIASLHNENDRAKRYRAYQPRLSLVDATISG